MEGFKNESKLYVVQIRRSPFQTRYLIKHHLLVFGLTNY